MTAKSGPRASALCNLQDETYQSPHHHTYPRTYRMRRTATPLFRGTLPAPVDLESQNALCRFGPVLS